MSGYRPSAGHRLVALLATVLVAAGCTASSSASEGGKAGPTAKPSPSSSPVPAVTAALAPANGAKDVVTSTDITPTVANGTLRSVALAAGGKAVAGALTPDGKAWRPSVQLEYGTSYTAVATAADAAGKAQTFSTTFTTMAAPSTSQIVGADLYFSDGDTVGVGMPLVVEFSKPIPAAFRADVERRLSVTTTPPVAGSWYWHGGGAVHYRPEKYWAPGTKIDLRVGIGGAQMGPGRFGKRDRVASITVGPNVYSRVDNATKSMKVYKDGALVRTMPVSMGKPGHETSSGVMVVMEKRPEMWMDSSTYGVAVDSKNGYRTKVFSAVRYTWGGEFMHGAPWSVDAQGHRNVSHGCVNLSPENARWYLDFSKKGDVVEIVGTGRNVKDGDGWTDWNIPWDKYQAGSALR
jgi:lipoprotein-anchoring transpeptidase ErfK/SrfK